MAHQDGPSTPTPDGSIVHRAEPATTAPARTHDVPARQGPGRTASVGLAAALAAWIAALLFVHWPVLAVNGFHSPVAIDNPVFATTGMLLLDGWRPYVDFWDHKGPGIFLVNAMGLWLGRGAPWGIWVVSFAAVLAAALLAYASLRRLVGGWPAAAGTAFFVAGLLGPHANNAVEEYALPIHWGVVLAFAAWATGRRSAGGLGLAIGALGMTGFFFRANLVGAALACGLAATVVLLRGRRGHAFGALVGGGLAGAVAVTAVVLVWLASRGALADFWDQAIHFNASVYAPQHGLRRKVLLAATGIAIIGAGAPVPIAILGWLHGVWSALRRPARAAATSGVATSAVPEAAAWLAVLWPVVELPLAVLSGRNNAYYFMGLAAALALPAALLVAALLRARPIDPGAWPAFPRMPAAAIAVAAAFAVPTVLHLALRMAVEDVRATPRRVAVIDRLASYARLRTGADDRVLVWGHLADVYVLSERRPASRYFYWVPLITPGYTDSAVVRSFLADLERTRPRLILETPELPIAALDPATRRAEFAAHPALSSGAPVEEIARYVARYYRPLGKVPGTPFEALERR